MRKLLRIPIDTPDFLKAIDSKTGKTKQVDCTEKWKKRVFKFKNKQIKNSPSFNWYQLDNQLRPLLISFTQKHCAFCDCGFSNDVSEHFPIEHFYPKINFPDKAFEWNNLFPICSVCNTYKGDKFDTKLIKPDAIGYVCNKYFIFKDTGEIEPNPVASLDIQEQAKETIKIYNLNRTGLRRDRRDELEFYESFKNQKNDINLYSHRDFIEQVIK